MDPYLELVQLAPLGLLAPPIVTMGSHPPCSHLLLPLRSLHHLGLLPRSHTRHRLPLLLVLLVIANLVKLQLWYRSFE